MVEGTPLLRVQMGNCLEGSNPFLSATFIPRVCEFVGGLDPNLLAILSVTLGGHLTGRFSAIVQMVVLFERLVPMDRS